MQVASPIGLLTLRQLHCKETKLPMPAEFKIELAGTEFNALTSHDRDLSLILCIDKWDGFLLSHQTVGFSVGTLASSYIKTLETPELCQQERTCISMVVK